MPIPNVKQAVSDVLAVLKEAGGQATSKQISESLLEKWRLTEEEKKQPDSWAPSLYIKQMYRAINILKREGKISNPERGVWSTGEFPRPPKGKKEPPRLTHDEVVQKVKEMGEMLGKVVEPVPGVPYRHDCVWRDNPYANPKRVVEVCDKGNVDKDIASLIWAVKNWSAECMLVIFDESDFHTAQKKLAQESQIYPLKADDVLKLHALLQAGNIQAVRSIFGI